jgi:AcrR family transcriptional regulator
MARRPNPSTRTNILKAAVAVLAEDGLAAPVSRIAAKAGVAQGSVFNHFASKAVLLNETYLYLITDLQAGFPETVPDGAAFEPAMHALWRQWMRWKTDEPARRLTRKRLDASELITPETLVLGRQLEEPGSRFLRKAASMGALRDEPEAFVIGIITGIANTTMDFMTAHPAEADHYCEVGYLTFRRALL